MRTLVCGIAVLAIATSANALMLQDGGFENAGSAVTIPNSNSAGSLVSGWKYDVDRTPPGTLGGQIHPFSSSQYYVGSKSLRMNFTGASAKVAVYQILSDFPDGTTVNWTYAMKPVTLQSTFFIEVGYLTGVANGATTVDPNNPGTLTAVIIKKWDNAGMGFPTVNSWNTDSGSFTMSGNSTSNVAYFVRIGGGASNDVYFDNMSFYTPEPASLLLLALGLPMLRRRC